MHTDKPHITIDPALFERFPSISLGCLHYRAEVKEPSPAFWDMMEQTVIPETKARLSETELVKWEGVYSSREAYKAFGRSPSRYRVSSESLIRRIKKNEDLYRVNTIVDTNNLVSIRTGLSLGSFDLSKIRGNIVFRTAVEGEGYEGIGKNYINMEKMLILADDEGPFGSTTSDSRRAMVTETAEEILTVIYCFSDRMDIKAITEEAAEAFSCHAGAEELEWWTI